MIKNPQTDKTSQDIYDIISDITAINGKQIGSQNDEQQKNKRQTMESKALFSDQEKIFKERSHSEQ